MAEELIARRSALKYLGLLTATAAGREFLAGWLPQAKAAGASDLLTMHGMHHAPPPAAEAYAPQFFKPQEFETVEILTEMMIPTDDKPGAKEAQVANFIDFVVFAASEHKPELQKDWTEGLSLLDQLSNKKFGRAFHKATPAERETLLTEMSQPEHDAKARHPGFSFYELVKGMTVEGFSTSRVGLVDFLGYQGLTFLSEFPGCTHPEHQT